MRAIRNGAGYDFVVFENGMISQITTALGSLQGQFLAELAWVEVSSNGRDFVRFPSVSLTPGRTGPYGTSEIEQRPQSRRQTSERLRRLPGNAFRSRRSREPSGRGFGQGRSRRHPIRADRRRAGQRRLLRRRRRTRRAGYRAPLAELRREPPDLRPVADLGFRGLRSGGRRHPARTAILGGHQPRRDRGLLRPVAAGGRLAVASSVARTGTVDATLASRGICSSTAAISRCSRPSGIMSSHGEPNSRKSEHPQ